MRGPIKQTHIRRNTLHDRMVASTRYRPEAEPIIAENVKELPPPPKDLSAVAKAEWVSVSKELFDAGLLKTGDLTMLRQYCLLAAMCAESEAIVNKNGSYDKYGKLTAPAKSVQRIVRDMQHIREQFGLTNAQRARLAGRVEPPDTHKDAFEEFLANGKN